jgi:tryptophan synthase beta chain
LSPEHSFLKSTGRVEYVSATDKESVHAFQWLSEKEGILPALESSHAIAFLKQRDNKLLKGDNVVICLSGRGDKDVHTVADFINEDI